jgi:hypothetical protein
MRAMREASEVRMFFLEKKNQKTFDYLPPHRSRKQQTTDESFLFLFLKKEALAFSRPNPRAMGARGDQHEA